MAARRGCERTHGRKVIHRASGSRPSGAAAPAVTHVELGPGGCWRCALDVGLVAALLGVKLTTDVEHGACALGRVSDGAECLLRPAPRPARSSRTRSSAAWPGDSCRPCQQSSRELFRPEQLRGHGRRSRRRLRGLRRSRVWDALARGARRRSRGAARVRAGAGRRSASRRSLVPARHLRRAQRQRDTSRQAHPRSVSGGDRRGYGRAGHGRQGRGRRSARCSRAAVGLLTLRIPCGARFIGREAALHAYEATISTCS